MSPAYHPQSDEQLEKMIQTLEVMLMFCVLDWKGSWGSIYLYLSLPMTIATHSIWILHCMRLVMVGIVVHHLVGQKWGSGML